MTEKSYVGLESKVCQICGFKHKVGLLFDRRLEKSLEMDNLTGYEACSECKKMIDDGYIAFVACDIEKSKPKGDHMKMEDAHRTGDIAWVHKSACDELFNVTLTETMVFTEPDVIEFLKKIQNEAKNHIED